MKKLKRSEGFSLDNLPEALLAEILCKLPTKTLVQCTSVCKSWRSLIKSPDFISAHLSLNHLRSKDLPLLIVRYTIRWRCSLLVDNQQMEEYLRLPHSLSCGFLIGSCNGLVCVCCSRMRVLFLWNPVIRKLRKISMSRITSSFHPLRFGFGYDSLNRDYKVLILLARIGTGQHYVQEIALYSLNSGYWKTLAMPRKEVLKDPGLTNGIPFVNGSLHCITASRIKKESDEICNVILRLDVSSEEFSEIAFPESLKCWKEGRLSTHVYNQSSIAVVKYDHLSAEVWVMREYGVDASWNKLCTIPKATSFLFGIPHRVKSFRKDGGIITSSMLGDLLWDNESKQHANFSSEDDGGRIGEVFPYVESLVLLDEDDGDYSRYSVYLETDDEDYYSSDGDYSSDDHTSDDEDSSSDDHATRDEDDAGDGGDYASDSPSS